jgi:signal transduction histidine kinase
MKVGFSGTGGDQARNPTFSARLGNRSTVALGVLIAGVLVVGGISVYLTSKITEHTDRIKTIAGKIEHADHIHFFMNELMVETNRGIIFEGNANLREDAGNRISSTIKALEEHIRHYNALDTETGLSDTRYTRSMALAIEGEINLLIRLVEKIKATIARGAAPIPEDLLRIRGLDDELRAKFFELNNEHQSAIARELQNSRRSMGLIMRLYLAFVVLGVFGLVGWNWLVTKTLVSPIRRLAAATHDVAEGDLAKRVPVTSKDEIGQLSYLFNVMAEKLRDHEEKLAGVAAMREREKIAHDLHDSLAQELAFIHLKLGEAKRALMADNTPRVKEIMRQIQKVAGSAYDDVRQAIFGLRRMVAKHLGLIPTLTEYLHEFSEQKEISVNLKVDPKRVPEFPVQTEVQLIRIIHEALTNVFKHSQAATSEVRFESDDNGWRVVIQDDGLGFDMEDGDKKGFHFGLTTMKERAAAVGGELKVESAPSRGTKIIVCFPCKKEAANETHSRSSRG